MTPDEIREALAMHWQGTQTERVRQAANHLHTDERTIWRWINGETKRPMVPLKMEYFGPTISD